MDGVGLRELGAGRSGFVSWSTALRGFATQAHSQLLGRVFAGVETPASLRRTRGGMLPPADGAIPPDLPLSRWETGCFPQ